MAQPLTNTDAIHAFLLKMLGDAMYTQLKKHHALEGDVTDLIGGELSLRDFGAALKETISIARNSLPDAIPPGGTKAFITLTNRDMDVLVNTITDGIAGRASAHHKR